MRKREMERWYIPAVSYHAHTLGFSHPVKLGTLLQVLFAADPLSVAETSFRQSIDITPCYSIR